ncbi:isopeptide-forming domain-containing fimbrial protein [Anaerococcus kampingiae]|uniref:Isopeptide-forming domain-containing fimbrial protein n=1 Tax=Anaerococcus kampingae TaxID=3115614 RepID=A0ABW9MGN3_9FIRM
MKRKILSLLTAFAMVFGIIAAPFTSASAAGDTELKQTTTKVTVHKLIPADKTTTAADIKAQIEALTGDNKYTGQKLDLATNVNKAKEIKDVYFVWTDKDRKVIDTDGRVVNPEIQLTEDGKLPEGKTIPTNALAGLTGKEGKEFDTSKLPAGEYHIYEIHSLSKYVGEKGETLTGTLAVPVVINLPLNDVVEAHVYPKNVQDLPKIDKNFDSENNGEATGIKNTEFTDTSKDVEIKLGTNEQDKDQREKGTAKKQLGDKVPYKVVTEIPKDAKYKKLVWTDQMTEGLKYNKDLAVTLGTETLTKGTHYTVINTDRGFTLKFTEAGLTKVEEAAKTAAQKVTLKYTATITAKAVPGKEDANDVAFDYGNKPGNKSEPKEGQPNNGEIKVEKSWAVDGKEVTEADRTVKALFTLQVKEGDEWKDVDSYEATSDEKFKHTFTGLDNNKTYRVVEQVSGYEPEYVSFENGVTVIKNTKDSTNPNPLNPSEPKVVTGGRKFVKADQTDGTRLAGAKFKVKRTVGDEVKFLKEKNAKDIQKAIADYKAADKEYKDAVAKLTQDNDGKITYPEGMSAASIKALREKRDTAYAAANISYEWVEETNATEFTSNDKGQVEVYGLAYGEGYTLVETAAPAGYGTPTNNEFPFTIDKDSYDKDANGVVYEGTDKVVDKAQGTDAMRINNKKVTIPQTGGIGSLVFIAAGLAIMGGAFIAYRRSQATA